MRLKNQQLNLFPEVKPTSAPRTEQMVMSVDALLKWKSRILAHQQQARQTQPPQQTSFSSSNYPSLPIKIFKKFSKLHYPLNTIL
ncbi:hypothetical protein [Nostoc sp. FACHB-145]|uniref:hypothetical protein n=1 Tax=Nostoc sp. FACHB-145 TaxID=2692836 RepID=UPI001687FC4C|nr:hypothetical protein [Nostoc sp. FACHB-145]MBD2471527.1 hypothetical protein [Nostoc sp. FACHB-145]